MALGIIQDSLPKEILQEKFSQEKDSPKDYLPLDPLSGILGI